MDRETYHCQVPVLFIVFNRLDTTKRVLEKISEAKPSRIYIAADGPRNTKEAEKCNAVINYVLSHINWPTEIYTKIEKTNLGCRLNVSSAISWFFNHEEKGIILEDDCLPASTFFQYCECLLLKYEDSNEVMHISGANNLHGKHIGDGSYYFSAISHIWGWASWRRAWKKYDIELRDLDQFIDDKIINSVFDSWSPRINFLRILKQIKRSKNASTWDFQWSYSIMKVGGKCVTPNYNLISNIGFGESSTHAWDTSSKFANIPIRELEEIKFPTDTMISHDADQYEGKTIYAIPNIFSIVRKIFQKFQRRI